MDSQRGNFSEIFSNIFSNKEANRYILVSMTVTILMFGYTGYDLFVVRSDAVNEYTDSKEWQISFETQNYTMQAVETVQDDETRNVIFDLSEINIPEGFKIGYIYIVITSEEESGISGQCDSVAGDIIENELTAQWNDQSNNLSGQDSSCIPIELDLVIYPNYDGETIEVYSINEFQALANWTELGWGEGELSIDLDLDVNAPLGLDPLGLDNDEEITIDVSVVMFRPIINLVE